MKALDEFMRNHFYLVPLTIFTCMIVGGLASLLFRLTRGKAIFAAVPSAAVFRERATSGRSLRHWWSRMGWASGCLCVYLTREQLRVLPEFPLTLFFVPEVLGLDLTVPPANIQSLQRKRFLFKPVIQISYAAELGETRVLELLLRKPDAFAQALYDLRPDLKPTTSS